MLNVYQSLIFKENITQLIVVRFASWSSWQRRKRVPKAAIPLLLELAGDLDAYLPDYAGEIRGMLRLIPADLNGRCS